MRTVEKNELVAGFLGCVGKGGLTLLIFAAFCFFLDQFVLRVSQVFLGAPANICMSCAFFALAFVLVTQSVGVRGRMGLFVLILNILFKVLVNFTFLWRGLWTARFLVRFLCSFVRFMGSEA